MRRTRKNSYCRDGGYTEVPVCGSSSYLCVAEAAAEAVGIEPSDAPEFQSAKITLFRSNGTIISDSPIPASFGSQPWTWNGYKNLLSKYTPQLKFGVGYVYEVWYSNSYELGIKQFFTS